VAKLKGKGGPGRGQGRHKLSEDNTVEATITLPESYKEYLKALGDGVVSKGVRLLVEHHKANHRAT